MGYARLSGLFDHNEEKILKANEFREVYGTPLSKLGDLRWEYFATTFLDLPAYDFAIDIFDNKDRVNGEAIINHVFKIIDENTRIQSLIQDSRFVDTETFKSFVMSSIANGTMSDINHRRQTGQSERTYYPCYCLNMELARYISIPTQKKAWFQLQNIDEKDFFPTKQTNIKIELNSFENFKATMRALLQSSYKKGHKFLDYFSTVSNSKKDIRRLEKIDQLVDQCQNANQIKNLIYCALNEEHNQSPESSLTHKEHYQLLLMGLKLANQYITYTEQQLHTQRLNSR